jgi:hypothetical protein
MNVEPELLDHPKFLRLERRIGANALKYLLRIWGHCAANKRGENWRQANGEYLECVARWPGNPGDLFDALVDIGWVDKGTEGIVIHDWNTNNSFTVDNWNRNPSGRKKAHPNPGATPLDTHGGSHGLPQGKSTATPPKAVANPLRVSEGDEGNEGSEENEGVPPPHDSAPPTDSPSAAPQGSNRCEWPTIKEWMTAACAEGLPARDAQTEWDNQERKVPAERWRNIDPSRLRHHAAFVHEQVRLRKGKKNGAAPIVAPAVDDAEMRDLTSV